MSEIEGLPYAEISPLELKIRREFHGEVQQHLTDSVELARARYLLKRIAGWVVDDQTPDPAVAASQFLKGYGHQPATQGRLI